MEYSLLYEIVYIRMLLWQNGKGWLDIHWFQASVKAGEICTLSTSGVQCLLVAICFLTNFWPFITRSMVLLPVAQKQHLTHYWKALFSLLKFFSRILLTKLLIWSFSWKYFWSWSFAFTYFILLCNKHLYQTNQPQTIKYPSYIDIHRFCFLENS